MKQPKVRYFLTTLILLIGLHDGHAQSAALPLYPAGVPNSKPTPATYRETNNNGGIRKVSIPTLTPYLAKGTSGATTAVIVCPGGGYSGLASSHEGVAIAKAFQDMGVSAFLLKYRLPSDSIMKDRSIGPLQDAQQAILMVREQAKKWNIDPARIGIIGFSAGGHLASTAGTHFEETLIDNPRKISLRPDFMMLIYPVITMTKLGHGGSRMNLVGDDSALVKAYSNETRVTTNTPPTFLMHATDDQVVPVQNSLMFYDALIANKVTRSSLFVFQEGGHGFGLLNQKSSIKWFDLLKDWMKLNKF